MGACISSSSEHSPHHKPRATVISIAGELRRYPLPITVSQVIQLETTTSSDSVFLCNSDRLYFDDYIPRLEPEEVLESDQIYFVMPASRLQRRLSASDMAALAVKASVALNGFNPQRSRRARISPISAAKEDPQYGHQIKINGDSYSLGRSARKASIGVSRSSKLQRHSSRRAKTAARSFRIRLTTVNEGSVLLG